MRIPFSSLRYEKSDPEQWRIMLYRNMPREFRYQMFTSRLPRDSNCFICNTRPLVGLAGLPSGSHWVVAPYVTGNQVALPRGGQLGNSLESDDPEGDGGLDAKWIPNPNLVFDATVNPDFSQIESDVAQISANERFALFFPERRPFFLEVGRHVLDADPGDLHPYLQPAELGRALDRPARQQPVDAPRRRGRRRRRRSSFPASTARAPRSRTSRRTSAVGRYRRDFEKGFASFLYSGREIDGGGNNRVFGPDFRWMPTQQDTITGQFLFSSSQTPQRPDLAGEWDGRSLSGWAGKLWWNRSTAKWDFFAQELALDDQFRADNGFVTQIGIHEEIGEVGRTFRPEGKFYSRLRLFTFAHQKHDEDGNKLEFGVVPGFGMDAKLNSFIRMEFAYHELLAIEKVHERWQLRPTIEIRPPRWISFFSLNGRFGQEVDFANDRRGDGMTINTRTEVRPTDHLLLTLFANRRTLDVDAENGRSGRLFTADVLRLRANYTFSAKSWLRLIGQWVRTERDPLLYTFAVRPEDEFFSGSAVFAYKLNWQTVLFVGYADNRAFEDERGDLAPADQSVFFKVSYAFQR